MTQARWAMAGWEEVDKVFAERKLLNVKALSDAYGRFNRRSVVV